MELDLSEAIEAGCAVSTVKWELGADGNRLRPYPFAKVQDETRRVLEIALPHIIAALAAKAEAQCAEECGEADLNNSPCDAYPAFRWLSTEAARL